MPIAYTSASAVPRTTAAASVETNPLDGAPRRARIERTASPTIATTGAAT
jgi:hypothetical protein